MAREGAAPRSNPTKGQKRPLYVLSNGDGPVSATRDADKVIDAQEKDGSLTVKKVAYLD